MFASYQITDVVSSLLQYGSVKSGRRRMITYSDEQTTQMGTEFASTHKDIGEFWRPFGGCSWYYGQSAEHFMSAGLRRVDKIRKDPEFMAMSAKTPDDVEFLTWVWEGSPLMTKTRDLIPQLNGWVWWVGFLGPIVWSLFVFRSLTLTGLMIVNGIWATEAFYWFTKYENPDGSVCGQSVMTYSWFGMWVALSGIWTKLKFRNFFSWSWAAIVAFAQTMTFGVELVSSQINDPTNFSEHNTKHISSFINGALLSHTGHMYGLVSGLGTALFLKNYNWI